MQQSQQMLPMIHSFPPTNITTEQIQKYLDENKKLILAILDNQNLGKLAECAQYQAQLQKNLMYLAAIADAQPQGASMPQMATPPAMQQGGQYMQYPQAAMARQAGALAPRGPLQFNPQQIQEQQQLQLHQQSMQGPLGMRSGANNGMIALHNDAIIGGGVNGGSQPSSVSRNEFTHSSGGGGGGGGGGGNSAGGASSGSLDVRGGKHDVLEAGPGDRKGNSAAGQGNTDGDPSKDQRMANETG